MQHFTKSVVFLYERNRIHSPKYITMKSTVNRWYWPYSFAIVLCSIFAFGRAGNTQTSGTHKSLAYDTVPAKKNQNTERANDKDLDKELQKLDEAAKKLENLKDHDWDKIERDVEEALAKIDFDKVRLQAEVAIKKVDMEKLGKEIEDAISKIDFRKIEQDIEAAMDELPKIDKEKIKQDIQKSGKELEEKLEKKEWRSEMEEVKKINLDEINKEMEKVHKELSKMKEDLKTEKFDMKETMGKAQIEIENAKEELRGYQEMIYAMEQDDLLNTKKDYLIEYKNGELSINGKKQSFDVTNKYKKYFKKDAISIRKEKGEIEIEQD